jgi:putative ABC transport system substrate-binding protein
VGGGIVDSLGRPGGNATGVSAFGPELAAKRLQLVQDMVPGLATVAVLRDPTPANALEWEQLRTAGETLGLRLQLLELQNPDDLDRILQAASEAHAEALFLMTGAVVQNHSERLIASAMRSKLPSMWSSRQFVVSGGLMAYGYDQPTAYRRAAYYVDRILKGASPADLPVERPMTFEFVVNMRTAQALGITFPNEIMLQVTEVFSREAALPAALRPAQA